MPFYEFNCKKCGQNFEIMSTMKDKKVNVKKGKCPKCGSKRKEEILNCPNYKFLNPVGTDRWTSDEKGHDFRHKFNVERPGGVLDQRKFAEEHSHMGANPYPDLVTQDVESGKHFGEVV